MYTLVSNYRSTDMIVMKSIYLLNDIAAHRFKVLYGHHTNIVLILTIHNSCYTMHKIIETRLGIVTLRIVIILTVRICRHIYFTSSCITTSKTFLALHIMIISV